MQRRKKTYDYEKKLPEFTNDIYNNNNDSNNTNNNTSSDSEKLDLAEKLSFSNYEIINTIFIVNKSSGEVFPKFVKVLDSLGYSFYIALNDSIKLKEIKGIKEEKYFEVSEADSLKYKLKLDKESISTIIKCVGCNIGGLLFECINGISYFSCPTKNVMPQEKVYIKILEKNFLHQDESQQIVNFMLGIETEDDSEFKYPIAYPVIELSEFLNEDKENIEKTVRCSIRSLRNNKLNAEETKFLDFIKNLTNLRISFSQFNELRTEILKNLNRTISILEKEAIERSVTPNKEEKILENIRNQLRKKHDLVVDMIRTYCIISQFNNIISWINDQISEIIQTLKMNSNRLS